MTLRPMASPLRLIAPRRTLAAGGRHLGFARDHAARWRTRRLLSNGIVLAVLRSPPGALSTTVIDARVRTFTARIYPRHSLHITLTLRPRLSGAVLEHAARTHEPPAGTQSTQLPAMARVPRQQARAATTVVRHLAGRKPAERVIRSLKSILIGPVSHGRGGPTTSIVHRVDRTRVHRIETVVHRVRGEPVQEAKPAAAAGAPRPIQSGHAPLGATTAVVAAATFSDTDVRRLTDRVVKDINRRILSERERLGRR